MPMWKSKISDYVDSNRNMLIAVADEIHSKPELAFEEVEAARILVEKLESAGFKGLSTI